MGSVVHLDIYNWLDHTATGEVGAIKRISNIGQVVIPSNWIENCMSCLLNSVISTSNEHRSHRIKENLELGGGAIDFT